MNEEFFEKLAEEIFIDELEKIAGNFDRPTGEVKGKSKSQKIRDSFRASDKYNSLGEKAKRGIKGAGNRIKSEAKTYKREFGDMYGKGGIARGFAKDVGKKVKSEAKQYGKEFKDFYGKGGTLRSASLGSTADTAKYIARGAKNKLKAAIDNFKFNTKQKASIITDGGKSKKSRAEIVDIMNKRRARINAGGRKS